MFFELRGPKLRVSSLEWHVALTILPYATVMARDQYKNINLIARFQKHSSIALLSCKLSK